MTDKKPNKSKSRDQNNNKKEPGALEKLENLDIPEAAKPALQLALFDLVVQTAAMVLKHTAEDRTRKEMRRMLGKKAAKQFEKRENLVRGAALSVASKSLPMALLVGGAASGVLLYGYAKKKRDARQNNEQGGTQNNSGQRAAGKTGSKMPQDAASRLALAEQKRSRLAERKKLAQKAG